MEDLEILPIVVLGIGLLLVWGGLSGQSPVDRVKAILTRGGVQSQESSTPTASTASPTGTYIMRRDYLA